MKLCYVVDFRSPHARNWIAHFVREGHEVHVVTTFPAEPTDPAPAAMYVIPLDFSARARTAAGTAARNGSGARSSHGSPAVAKLRGGALWTALARLRDRVSPLAVALQRRRVARIFDRIQPDLVHSMRIPFEGILTTAALRGRPNLPYIQSIWGNDFTLFAEGSAVVGRLTRAVTARADGLHPDCRKDMEQGWAWGFDRIKPWTVLPGGGGVHTDVFRPAPHDPALARQFGIPDGAAVVINPRGVKPYVRTDSFFQAIPIVLESRPDTIFLCAMMEGNRVAEGWTERLAVAGSVRLLPYIDHPQMASLFQLADVTVSPSDHDGTPNTLLEGMACGAFPVAGAIDSVREWIVDGKNGFLVDQSDPASIASGILRALADPQLRAAAAAHNSDLIRRTVSYASCMTRVEAFYGQVIASRGAAPARSLSVDDLAEASVEP